MEKSLGTNMHFWRFCAHVRREYNLSCRLTSPPPPIQCWKLLPAISSNFQQCIEGEGKSNPFLNSPVLDPFSCHATPGREGPGSFVCACSSVSQFPFSSPEAALLLVSTKNRDLWPSPTTEGRDSRTSRNSAHAESQVWQICSRLSLWCLQSH